MLNFSCDAVRPPSSRWTGSPEDPTMGCALVIVPSLGRRHRHEPDLSASGCIKAIDPVETAIDALDKIPPDLADFLVRVAASVLLLMKLTLTYLSIFSSLRKRATDSVRREAQAGDINRR